MGLRASGCCVVICLSALAACNDQSGNGTAPLPETLPELGSFGIDLSYQDSATVAGDDFFQFASGQWLNSFELPDDRSNYGAFNVLRDRSDERVVNIIEELGSKEPEALSLEGKISNYYNSYMDTETLDEKGISPLVPSLAIISEVATTQALTRVFGRSQREGTASPLSFYVGADRSDPDQHQLVLSIGGLGLPDRDYYLLDTDEFETTRGEYVAHIERMLGFADVADAGSKAADVLRLETKLAELIWPRSQRRDRDLTYNPMTYLNFVDEYPGLDWDAYFSAAGIENLESLNVSYPSAMAPLIALISEAYVDDWVSYVTYHHISSNADLLSTEINQENFYFYSTILNGVPKQRERWERAVAKVGSLSGLGEPVGQVYVQQHFPESAKEQMEQLVENLRAALAQSITELDWMGEETKAEARLKLNSFRPKIAYPDEWRDFSEVKISKDDLYTNNLRLREFNYEDEISRLGTKTNREEWGMTPQTVNAYYNSAFNEIVFPAGILQPPFFDPAADMAVNYGGIGAVIGHEMGHGFDDQGSKSDYQGIQRNWWTDQDRANFEELTSALAAQYDNFEPVPGYFVDGNFTLGENIGDVGGLSIAYRAYKISLDGAEAPIIDGFTGDQRFFLAWAQVWRQKIRDGALIRRLTADPHSPAEYRVNGVVRNFDEWYEAFDVTSDDALYLPPEERVRIW